MRKIKQINIKNRTYYFYDDMINIKDFDSRMLKLDTLFSCPHYLIVREIDGIIVNNHC